MAHHGIDVIGVSPDDGKVPDVIDATGTACASSADCPRPRDRPGRDRVRDERRRQQRPPAPDPRARLATASPRPMSAPAASVEPSSAVGGALAVGADRRRHDPAVGDGRADRRPDRRDVPDRRPRRRGQGRVRRADGDLVLEVQGPAAGGPRCDGRRRPDEGRLARHRRRAVRVGREPREVRRPQRVPVQLRRLERRAVAGPRRRVR